MTDLPRYIVIIIYLSYYTSDNMLRTVFMPQCLAIDLVNSLFNDCVS